MSRLSEKFSSSKKVITAEITPPKGAGIKKLIQNAMLLKPFVDAVNITDCQRGLVRMSSLAACRVLLDCDIEPVYQLTCRDRNGIALQSDLMGAWALKIPNLLCLTGDPVKVGDHPTAKSVFEVEAVGLLKMVKKLQTGRDLNDHKMNAPTKFYVGAVVNPTLRSEQYGRMLKKIEAGASFFQTQANYDLNDFVAFLKETKKLNVKVLAGILVLHSKEIANYIHTELPGVQLPTDLLNALNQDSDPRAVGLDFAVQTMLEVENYCDGFHLMSIRAEELIPTVLEKYYARTTQNRTVSLSSATGC